MVVKEFKTEPEPEEPQSMLTSFNLYKCLICGKMVMGYDQSNHVIEKLKEGWKPLKRLPKIE